MPASRDGNHGPGWSDVRMMMAEVGAAHNVRVDIHMSAAVGANRSNDVVWSVRAWNWGTWGESKPLHYTSGIYPGGAWATVPALLYNLLHRMDSELTLAEESKRSARPFALPGLDT
jgi:hypothetical protein